jgi:hypothetical protein
MLPESSATTTMSAPATLAVAPSRAKASSSTATSRRRALATLVAMPMTTRAVPSRANDEYATDTLATLDAAARLARGEGKADDDALVDGWYARNKSRYDNSTQGRSFLMTTKVVGLLRARGAGGDFDEGKFDEWVRLSRGFTDGSISGKAQREAYGNAVWANNDKTDAKNRIGLCIFGETAGTKALGVVCDGF